MEVIIVLIVATTIIWAMSKMKNSSSSLQLPEEDVDSPTNTDKFAEKSIDGQTKQTASELSGNDPQAQPETKAADELTSTGGWAYRENLPFQQEQSTTNPKERLNSRRTRRDIPSSTASSPKLNTVIESASSADESEDSLASFTLFQSSHEQKKDLAQGKKGQWQGKYREITIHGRRLKGLLFVGDHLESLRQHQTEPALINQQLSVFPAKTLNKNTKFYIEETIGYWPSYSTLSKGSRSSYLDWLATDRDLPNTPISFVFLYFYGLERFVIENRQNRQVSNIEFEHIFDEVLRLHRIFNHNRSFASYSTHFLALMVLLRPDIFQHRSSEIPTARHSLLFKMRLAVQIAKYHKVGPELALEWIKNTDEYRLKTAAIRCKEQFDQLFKIHFENKFPIDMTVRPNKTKLMASYQPASNGISTVNITLDDLPDPSILKAPIKQLIPLAEQCCEELAAYSRYLGKADTTKDDVAALMLLPPALAPTQLSPRMTKFKEWATQVITQNEGVANVAEFWSHTGLPTPNALNKKENELIINLAQFAGIGIAPDLRFHHAKLKLDGNIVMFTPAHGNDFKPSDAFNQTGVALRLGAMIATIDGVVQASEKNELRRLIDNDEKLSLTEKHSLHAYLTWRLVTPPNTSGLKARLEQLGAKEIEFVKRFIICIALADGHLDNKELKQLEKLYARLGLDKDTVSSDVHHLTSSGHQSDNQEEKGPLPFSLDETILALHESDTSQAKTMLEEIFTADEDEDEDDEHQDTDTNTFQPHGLDEAHSSLFDKLCVKEQWSRNEVAQFCAELQLMPDGAIETINDWAFDLLDAPVLEDDGDIYVDNEIVEEIREL